MESNLTAVQRLAKQFENLAQTKNDVKQQKCNWWLENAEEEENSTNDRVETDDVPICDYKYVCDTAYNYVQFLKFFIFFIKIK